MNPFKRKQEKGEPSLILDTCGVIDGRIVDIAKAGFVPQNIVIPKFIIAELQYLADNGDAHKRERARHGLDVMRMLQEIRRVNVSIAREQFSNIKEVDDKLVALAKQMGGYLYTTDYNLNKVAQIEGITVLNVNELAQALRPRRLPGEQIEIKITQQGQDKTQGVGYLEDGTMVVVEKAGNKIGQRIIVEFSRMLQTQAGKMMFAVLPQNKQQPRASHSSREPREEIVQPRPETRSEAPTTFVKPVQPVAPAVYHAVPSAQKPEPLQASLPTPSRPSRLERPANEETHQPRQPHTQRRRRPQQHRPQQPAAQSQPHQAQSRAASTTQRRHAPRHRKDSPEDSLLKALEESK